MIRRLALSWLALALGPSCAGAGAVGAGPGTNFKVAAFQLRGGSLARNVDPGPDKIEANQHYVSIAIEQVRIHKGRLRRPLALVLKVTGALPTGGEFQAILGTINRPDDDGYYSFMKPAVLDPFVYKGQPLIVELSLAPCTEDWEAKIDAAKKEWGDVRHIDPNAFVRHPVDATHLGSDGSDWLKAAFATAHDPNSLPLAAGRYVIFSAPDPVQIHDKVTFDERGLIWKGRDEVVKGVSFATIFINRRKRGPRRDTILEQTKRQVENAITAGRLDDARAALAKLPDMIDRDPHTTQPEKELDKARLKLYQIRIERRAAKDAKDKATFVSKTDDALAALNEIRKKFGDMLEPFEVNQMRYMIKRYLREREQ